jgi:DNA-binding PadR family transcriptional regulator
MGARVATNGNTFAMRSPVNWALLGLLIERTGYGYDLFQRFERTYGGALELSCPAQIYKALTALEGRGLIERLPADEAAPAELRQPKPHYRASAEGLRGYQDWLIAQVRRERQRSELFPRQLATLPPRDALAVLDRYERHLLQEQRTAANPPALDGASVLARELVEEVSRLEAVQALKWTEYARRKLQAAIG